MFLIETIEDYFTSVEECVPVITDDVFRYAKKYYSDLDRAVFNEYMTRVCDRNPLIKRYQRGVYYKTRKTQDGYADIRIDLLLKKVYLGEGDSIYGYMTGPSFMNRMGLTKDRPESIYVVSNNYRSLTVDFENVILIKPITNVNKENYKYLQVLDMLYNKWGVTLVPNYLSIIYGFVQRNELEFEKLLVLSDLYPGSSLPKKLVLLAKEGNNN